MIYHVFSDASMRYGSVGYAYSITDRLCIDKPRYVMGFLPDCLDTVAGEITASAIALAAVPPGASEVILWSDLDQLPHMLSKCWYPSKLQTAMLTLREATLMHGNRVTIASVDRSSRIYRSCHAGAYKAAMLCALETGRYKPTRGVPGASKKKKWPRRRYITIDSPT
jgi:hypothetical protein